jgi:hypothetical protein
VVVVPYVDYTYPCSFADSFRPVAQLVSSICLIHRRSVVQVHSGLILIYFSYIISEGGVAQQKSACLTHKRPWEHHPPFPSHTSYNWFITAACQVADVSSILTVCYTHVSYRSYYSCLPNRRYRGSTDYVL